VRHVSPRSLPFGILFEESAQQERYASVALYGRQPAWSQPYRWQPADLAEGLGIDKYLAILIGLV